VDRRLLKNIDFTIIIAVVILIIFGLIVIYSVSSTNPNLLKITGNNPWYFTKKRLSAIFIGIIGFLILLQFDYRLSKRMNILLYCFNIFVLGLVLVIGSTRSGAKSWLFGFQPSELSKLLLIVTFGNYLATKESLNSYYDFIMPFLYMGLPLFLILLQPDLGTALVYIFFMFIMMYIAGAPGRKLIVVFLIPVIGVALLFLLHNYFGTPLPIKPYQIARLTSFIDPERDPQGSGWHVIQSQIAVGSGQFFGKGWLKGTQGRLGFLPEPHTDFVFANLCEEFGFVGGFGVLFLFFILIWRGIHIAVQARDKTGSIIAAGIVAMWLFHILENAGMNIGLMPITGIPLPFVSYGGTSMLVNILSTAVLMNIWVRHQKIMF